MNILKSLLQATLWTAIPIIILVVLSYWFWLAFAACFAALFVAIFLSEYNYYKYRKGK